jgi:hypothetical protein
VDTVLSVWAEGAPDRPRAEATAPLADLSDAELAALARGASTPRLAVARPAAPAPRGSVRLGDACEVRFGTKTGCNAFFQLLPHCGGRFESALAGDVPLGPSDVVPLLASLRRPARPSAVATRVLFRPAEPSRAARAYLRLGEAAAYTCGPPAPREAPWWRLAPGRGPAPVLYPAKVSARAFAFVNAAGLWEDKKWHALFPRELPPWQVAAVLGATPVRLAIDAGARQLTGAQAIADVDCRVLAAAPFPALAALARVERELADAHTALAADPVTTDVRAMLARPAQRALDAIVGGALGLAPGAVERARRELVARVEGRLAHAEAIRRVIGA